VTFSEDPASADVHQRIAAMARELHAGAETEAEVINEVAASAAREIPGAQYAGVTLVHQESTVQTVGSTHHYPDLLDAIQQRHLEGPCLSAAWLHETVKVDDLTADERWPRYQRDATEQTPIRSVLAFRLFTSAVTLGALNVYSEHRHAFDQSAEEIGSVLATHAALAWDTVRRDGQFRSALASRDLIGQAKGILMERFDVDAVRAFEMLKRISQESNTPLADIARRLIELPRGKAGGG